MITRQELIKKYLDFFAKRGHQIIPSASLIPENDPTVLFTTAGMHPLVPYLLGEKHPAGQRLTNVQKCIRTNDIDEVGDSYHHTFFEMLGHWSLGDYFKEEAIKMSYEFLTKELKLNPKSLAFSVFAGDQKAPRDETAAQAWKSLGVPESRIAYLSAEENWWEPAGSGGPCGPSTEMFYWTNGETTAPTDFDPADKRWVEIGNDVLMEYKKTGPGQYQIAKQKNIDNGTGVERTLAVINGLDDNYQTELFKPIIKEIERLSGKKYNDDEKIKCSIRIIADHSRAATFILGDQKGISPSNLGQGYVLRRLIRRAIRLGKKIGITKPFAFELAEVTIKNYGDEYPELKENKDFILEQLVQEEEKFNATLEKGLKIFKKMSADGISGKEAFVLFSTYGFPWEMTEELAAEEGVKIDKKDFEKEFNKHQDLSRIASAGKFKGGLADHSEQTTKLHTATHLLLAALRKVLGDQIYQKGSNITSERLRLDFSYSQKLSLEEIKQIQDLVNQQIKNKIEVKQQEMSLDEAKKENAMGVFEHKYADKVKVYTINDFSKEICGGPHVKNTGELGHFKITKEEAVAAGIRRIKAILE